MATLTVKQFSEKLNRKIKELETDKILRTAVLAITEKRSERIFEKGLNSNNSQIGQYNSTKPIYVSPADAPRKVNGKGKTGKKIKSGYYSSYRDFRAAMGRETSFVNLRLTNEFQNDLNNAKIGKSSNKTSIPSPIKVSNTRYEVRLKRQINIDKADGLTKKYGEFLKHTEGEKKLFNEIIAKEVNLLLAK